jgi:molybdopterin/thiamine biosynthesis adenylyltransferase
MGRYDKNGIFSTEDMNRIQGAKICVIGCGGLGGYIVEMLARAGVGEITAVDGDVFEDSNMNRQILSTVDNIGRIKVHQAKERLKLINPNVIFHPIHAFLDEDNAESLIARADVVVDALDQIPVRFILQDACEKSGIPMVYGAIAGWYGQISTIMPGDRTLDHLYPDYKKKGMVRGVETGIGNPSFTPALAASIQVSECLKIITGQGELLRSKMLYVDLFDNEMMVVQI